MNDALSALPWNHLLNTEGDIPWAALHTIADALPGNPEAVHRLFEIYEQTQKALVNRPSFGDVFVAAIFALAGPRLEEAGRREVGRFALEKLVEAGRDDDDFIADPLVAACGAMGPVVLPSALDAIANEPDDKGAWFWLWGLTMLAAETDDEALRDRTIGACVDLLERAARGEVDPGSGMTAGWTLAAFKSTEHIELLERVHAGAALGTRQEFEHILDALHGRSDYTPEPFWRFPVERWLESRWRTLTNSSSEVEPGEEEEEPEGEEGEPDPDLLRAQAIALRFVLSPAARTLPPELYTQSEYIIRRLVHSSSVHLDMDATEWDEPALRELLVDVLPANLLPQRDFLAAIAPVTEAFLYFLHEQMLLSDVDTLARAVRSWSDQIVANGLDPSHWSPLKRRTMAAIEAGENVLNPEVKKAMADDQAAEHIETLVELGKRDREGPLLPISEYTHHVGRNDPCPCGSGRKYKKCCGNPAKSQESPT